MSRRSETPAGATGVLDDRCSSRGTPPRTLLPPGIVSRACTRRPRAYPASNEHVSVAYQTTVGWSLFTSGIVTLLLAFVPGDSVWWGVGLLVVGIAVLAIRQFD